jgi:hypothetical protein
MMDGQVSRKAVTRRMKRNGDNNKIKLQRKGNNHQRGLPSLFHICQAAFVYHIHENGLS